MERPDKGLFSAFASRKRTARDGPFSVPQTATSIRRPAAFLFLATVYAAALVCIFSGDGTAFWPAPMPLFSTLALAVLVAFTGSYGAAETVDGLAEYSSLAMPISFAMLLLLDWRHFAAAIVLGEILTFCSEAWRRVNPTKWYIRIFNASELIVAGAAAVFTFRTVRALVPDAYAEAWFSPALFLSLGLALVVWKLLDDAQTKTVIALATGKTVRLVRFPPRLLLSQLTLLSIAVPFAAAWHQNFWLAIFALSPLVVAFHLLGVPELEHRATVDERTGLTNAGAFDTALEKALDEARQNGRTLALIAIDIDRFKEINDARGHQVGDDVIKGLADVLAAVARRGDITARTGGEEFAVLLLDGDRVGAVAFAERLRERVAETTFAAKGDGAQSDAFAVTASFGVALFPEDGDTPRALFYAADSALYAAKRGGRNRVCEARRPAIGGEFN